MQEVDLILDFAVHLGQQLLESGANLERVNDTICRICSSYRLKEVSIFSLNGIILLSAASPDGTFGTRQVTVSAAGIHLEYLRQLNELSRQVCAAPPAPETLAARLAQVKKQTFSYPAGVQILGYVVALASLCLLFGGSVRDMLTVCAAAVVLYGANWLLAGHGLNKILSNTLSMFIAGSLAQGFARMGISHDLKVVIISLAFMLIPGIQLTNAVRNLLCGNEMNGILELFKVVLETLSIVLGLVLSIFLFGGWIVW